MRAESTKQTTSLTDTKVGARSIDKRTGRGAPSILPGKKSPSPKSKAAKRPCTVNSHGQSLQQTHFQAPVLMAQGGGELASLRTSWNLSQDSWLQEPLGE